jgi:hypothetical protein
MNKLFVATIALVTVFSMPASAAHTGPGSHPRFRDVPDVSRNTEANPEHHASERLSNALGGFNRGDPNDPYWEPCLSYYRDWGPGACGK